MEERIRKMSKNELLIAVDWAKQEGWDPGLNDTDAFWKTDPNGFYALEKDEKMIGGSCIKNKGQCAYY